MTEYRIMVVDDEAPIRNMYLKGFSRAGYSVYAAESAEEAIAMLPDTACMVYFLDLCLPGMNGIELCRQIRKGWPMTICHAVTGYASLFQLNDCRQAGFEDYYLKPVSLANLLAAAKQAFAKIERWKIYSHRQ
jgi:CheY-like chemotaxis protein